MQPLPTPDDIDIVAKLAVQLPILTGVLIVAVAVYLAFRFDDARRRRDREELFDLIKRILELFNEP